MEITVADDGQRYNHDKWNQHLQLSDTVLACLNHYLWLHFLYLSLYVKYAWEKQLFVCVSLLRWLHLQKGMDNMCSELKQCMAPTVQKTIILQSFIQDFSLEGDVDACKGCIHVSVHLLGICRF